jgi:hypothetical protein
MPDEESSSPFPFLSDEYVHLVYEQRWRWNLVRTQYRGVLEAEHCALQYLARIGVYPISVWDVWRARYRESQWRDTFCATVLAQAPPAARQVARVAVNLLRLVASALEAVRDYDNVRAMRQAAEVEMALQHLWRAEMLGELPIGRPQSSGWYEDAEALRRAVLTAIGKIRATGHYPNQDRVAAAMVPQLTKRHLQRTLKKYGLSWSVLLNTAK